MGFVVVVVVVVDGDWILRMLFVLRLRRVDSLRFVSVVLLSVPLLSD